MSFQRLIDHLNDQQMKFTFETHSPAYTSQEVAERVHVHGLNMGKVVVIVFDGCLALCLLPSHYHVECRALAEQLGASELRIANEGEFQSNFPQCETGAIPPFSMLWGMPVYMSSAFDREQEITFNAGSWSEVIRMPCKEYIRLEQPIIILKGVQAPGVTVQRTVQISGQGYQAH